EHPLRPVQLGAEPRETGFQFRERVFIREERIVWIGDDGIWVSGEDNVTARPGIDVPRRDRVIAAHPLSEQIALVQADGRLRITTLKEHAAYLDGSFDGATVAWFSGDGTRLVTAKRKGIDFFNVTLWDARQGNRVGELRGDFIGKGFGDILLTADGSRILPRPPHSGPTVLWNALTGLPLTVNATPFVTSFGFLFDGSLFYIVSGLSNDGLGGVWIGDSTTGKDIWNLRTWILEPVLFGNRRYVVVYGRSPEQY